MMSWLQRLSRKRRKGVAIFDGERWSLAVFEWQDGEWTSVSSTEVASRNARHVPEALIDAAIEAGASAVRVLLPADIRVGAISGADDLEPEELHTALAYELAADWGHEPDKMRLAFAPGAMYGLGFTADQFLVAGFDQVTVESFARSFVQAGIRFDGLGALELALLAAYSGGPDQDWLFLRKQAGFLATAGTERQPPSIGTVPVGLQEDATESGRERVLRLQRRLQASGSVPLNVIAMAPPEAATPDGIRPIIGPRALARVIPFDEARPLVCEAALEPVYPLAQPPPPPRDPNRVGTWICLGVIFLTAMLLFAQWRMLTNQISYEKVRKEAWSTLQTERASHERRFDDMRAERDRLLTVERLFQRAERFPPALPVLMEALTQGIPTQTRITRIRQTGPNAFELEGKTRWANGKVHLHRLLTDTLFPLGIIVEPGKLQFHEDALEQEFIYLLTPEGGRE